MICGVQAGNLGLWIYDEIKLSDQFVLRSEVGFSTATYGMYISVCYWFYVCSSVFCRASLVL